ncbi:hypothetical protein J6590_035318 [Homalodisca vitripennis]|nr:hypothetical protein J6590_035318 [Homalodisca vitripennis]
MSTSPRYQAVLLRYYPRQSQYFDERLNPVSFQCASRCRDIRGAVCKDPVYDIIAQMEGLVGRGKPFVSLIFYTLSFEASGSEHKRTRTGHSVPCQYVG